MRREEKRRTENRRDFPIHCPPPDLVTLVLRISLIPLLQMTKMVKKKRASVLIPLCHDKDGKPAILFTTRSENLRRHSGQVCFPGGMVDRDDRSITDTALRELQEEIGISEETVDVRLRRGIATWDGPGVGIHTTTTTTFSSYPTDMR